MYEISVLFCTFGKNHNNIDGSIDDSNNSGNNDDSGNDYDNWQLKTNHDKQQNENRNQLGGLNRAVQEATLGDSLAVKAAATACSINTTTWMTTKWVTNNNMDLATMTWLLNCADSDAVVAIRASQHSGGSFGNSHCHIVSGDTNS